MTDAISFGLGDEPIRPYRPAAPEMVFPDHVARRLGVLAGFAIVLSVCAGVGFFYVSLRQGAPAEGAVRLTPPPARHEPAAPQTGQTPEGPLLLPKVDYTQTFSNLSTHPADLCQTLTDAGFSTTAWRKSQWDASTWECSAAQRPDDAAGTDGMTPSGSLFFIFRGTAADKITSLRVKLNFLDARTDDAIASRARHFLDLLDGFKDLDVPPRIIEAVANRQTAAMSTFAGNYRFEVEKGDARRFNLTVAYYPTAGVLTTSPQALNRDRQPAIPVGDQQ
jgi:hypothetical protein